VSAGAAARAAAAAAAHHRQRHTHGARGSLVTAAAASAPGVDAHESLSDEDEYGAADNFYDILGVPLSASQRDIKRAYKVVVGGVSGCVARGQGCQQLN
jgi:hypothetical protein